MRNARSENYDSTALAPNSADAVNEIYVDSLIDDLAG